VPVEEPSTASKADSCTAANNVSHKAALGGIAPYGTGHRIITECVLDHTVWLCPPYIETAVFNLFRLGGDMQISRTLEARPHRYPGLWFIAKAGLVLAAILLLTLTVAALEMQWGITPSDDDATAWTLSGE
jgi:hypothetical protein